MKIQQIPIDKIKPYPNNQKRHPESQLLELKQMIIQYGFLKPILLDENYEIIAGEGAFEAGKMAGRTKIPCIIHSGMSERKKRAFRIADNKIAEKSIWEFDRLVDEINALVEMDFDIELTGFDDQEIEELLKDSPALTKQKSEKQKKIPVSAHERKASSSKTPRPVTISGDKFTLGGIEIVCKDPEGAPDCDWLIRRWQSHSSTNAVHSSGMTFNKLEDARK